MGSLEINTFFSFFPSLNSFLQSLSLLLTSDRSSRVSYNFYCFSILVLYPPFFTRLRGSVFFQPILILPPFILSPICLRLERFSENPLKNPSPFPDLLLLLFFLCLDPSVLQHYWRGPCFVNEIFQSPLPCQRTRS